VTVRQEKGKAVIRVIILQAEIDDTSRSILTEENIPEGAEIWGVIDYRDAMLMSICDEMSYNIEKAIRPIHVNAVVIIQD
jgi:hypothetical protein